ncbi:transcriptional repressor [Ceratobasidium sp. 395]|nr:transcriptional repressor [Ceratobasidium sp. 395]
MSHASTHAPMMSRPPSPVLAGPTPLQQPTLPQHQQAWSSMPPPPTPGQADDNKQAKPDIASAPASPGTSVAMAAQKAKKKHVCATCTRPFSTSGHLARHTRVHTGEQNRKCPFPSCETRCSRQDNLQQHYRIDVSPKSRRTSTRLRAAIARAIKSAVHDDMSGQGVHATHPSPHSCPSLHLPPWHPHYAAAPPYGAYPQPPPPPQTALLSILATPSLCLVLDSPTQSLSIPADELRVPPPAPGQPPVYMQGDPQPLRRTTMPPSTTVIIRISRLTRQVIAPGQSAATSRAASTSGSNSLVQQLPRTTQAAPLPAANALGLQNSVNKPVKSNQWNGQVDQNDAAPDL